MWGTRLCTGAVAVALAVPALPVAAAGPRHFRASVSSSGAQANGDSWNTSLSAGGRYVAFTSGASNLVPGDTNANADVFVRDRRAGTTERVSVGGAGRQVSGYSGGPVISADGRYVAFFSDADNLVRGDTNGVDDTFVRDRRAGTTERISVSSSERPADDLAVPEAISADGRYVLFKSFASGLVAGDTNGEADLFVRDRRAGTTERVSVGVAGRQAREGATSGTLSADGRYVAFLSDSPDLVAGDSNDHGDVFVRDRRLATTVRVNVSVTGVQSDAPSYEVAISADGRYVAFSSYARNLVPGDTNDDGDIFVRDRRAGTTARISLSTTGVQANGTSSTPAISADGRHVVFESRATNLAPGAGRHTREVYVRDRRAGTTVRLGAQARYVSSTPAISGNGRCVAFASDAALVPGDTNGAWDVYVTRR